MADAPQRILRQRLCRACTTLFWICRRCDHGQRYCSSACRLATRRAQLRAAERRHRRQFRGRLNHSRQQQRYRDKIKAGSKNVGHQGSIPVTISGIMPPWDSRPATPPPRLCCLVCGIRGAFTDPFPYIPTAGW